MMTKHLHHRLKASFGKLVDKKFEFISGRHDGVSISRYIRRSNNLRFHLGITGVFAN